MRNPLLGIRLRFFILTFTFILASSLDQAVAVEPAIPPLPPEEIPDDILASVTYPVDPAGLKAEYRATGLVTLTLPGPKTVRFSGQEVDFWEEKVWRIVGASREDILAEGPIEDIALVGELEESPRSFGRPLLGMFGVYGRIWADGIAYDFEPRRAGGVHFQHVTSREAAYESLAGWLPSDDPLRAQALTTAYVIYDVEQSYQSTHPDWYSRLDSAFANLYPMWTNVDIDLRLSGPWGWSEDVLTSDYDWIAMEDYKNWLAAGHLSSIAKSYQLWTTRNLNAGWPWYEAGVFARAHTSDSVQYLAEREKTATIAEGTDYCCDLYDANSAFERGSVSGHEFSHIFGEESHRADCKTSTDCNLLESSSVSQAYRSFWWTAHSQSEIRARFHLNDEWPN